MQSTDNIIDKLHQVSLRTYLWPHLLKQACPNINFNDYSSTTPLSVTKMVVSKFSGSDKTIL